MTKKTTSSEKLAEYVSQGMLELKAQDVVIMDLRHLDSSMTDFFVIGHGNSDKQVQSIAESIDKEVRKACKERPYHIEGKATGEWVLLDYINVVAHVFLKDKRDFYGLELLWGDAKINKVEETLA